MGVSLIQSNAAGFGCGLVVPGVRIFLQNRGIGFSLEPGHPAEYGPGRRPPHTLSPALVTRPDGTLDRVIGTMGGDSQPQVLLQLLARQLHSRQSAGRSIAAGRWALAHADGGAAFDTWRARGRVVVRVEGQAPAGWDDGLRERGHAVERAAAFDHGFGHAHVIVNEGDRLAGAADPRALVSAAAGY
jgi:gamma-glutamyltranspeptidase/glutathione hydrolase